MDEKFGENEEIRRLTEQVNRLTGELSREVALHRIMEDRLARYFRAIERSNAELEQFAYAASHDLQEPQRMVVQYATLLERDLRANHPDALTPDVELFLKHLVGGARRAKKLIDGLLTFSRAGKQSTFGVMSIAEALQDAVEMLNGAVTEAGATVSHDELPVAYGDKNMISRVLLNLITNAIRFAKKDEPARIHVSVTDGGHEWIVSVRDNGIGIDPRYAERVFGIFQRLDPAREGTGIGLAISKKVIEQHGGRIWVESLTDQGANFRFTLSKDPPGGS